MENIGRSNGYVTINFLLLGSIFVKMSFSVWIAFHYLVYNSTLMESSFVPNMETDSNSSLTDIEKSLILNNDENNAMKSVIARYIMGSNIVLLFGLFAICFEYKTLLFVFGVFSIILMPFSMVLINSYNIYMPLIMNFLNTNLSFILVKKMHNNSIY